ncbi:MAG: autotransporter domain-containing protein [Planctomycetota bacterium]
MAVGGVGDGFAQETHVTLTVGGNKTVTNSHLVTGSNPLGLDLLVTGPARTAAPTSHADALGTTIDSAGSLTIGSTGTARLAGVTNGGLFSISGHADTLFEYADGVGGPTESLFADVQNDGAVNLLGSGLLQTGAFANDGTATLAGDGTLTADGAFRNPGAVRIEETSTLNAGGSYLNAGGSTQVQGTGGTLNAGGRYENEAGATDIFSNGRLNAGGIYENSGGTTSVYGTSTLDAGTSYLNTGGTTHVYGDGTLTADVVQIDAGTTISLGSFGAGGGTLRVGSSLIVNGTLSAAPGGSAGPSSILLDPGAVLSGSGSLNTGTPFLLPVVAPGNSPGTLNFSAGIDTDADPVLLIEVAPTATPVAGVDNDQLVVAGPATIDGGTVRAQRYGAGNYVLGTEYTFLSAQSLTVNQEFVVVSDVVGVVFEGAFTPGLNGAYRLIVSRFETPAEAAAAAENGGTFNQRQTGAALTALGSGSVVAAFNAAANHAERTTLLSDLAGEIYAARLTAQAQGAARFFDLVTAQTFGTPGACAYCLNRRPGTAGWISGYGAGGRIGDDGNGRRTTTGVGGTAFGLTRCFANGLSAGTFSGFENLTTRVPVADSTVTGDLRRVGGWSRFDAGRAYLLTQGQLAYAKERSRRGVGQGLPSVVAGFDSLTSAADLEIGARYGNAVRFVAPALGLRYLHVDQDAFTEDGGAAALTVDASTHSALRARLGARAGARFRNQPAFGTLSAFVEHDLNAGSVGEIDAAFAAGGPSFTARGADVRRTRVTLGPGLVLGNGPVRLTADYRAALTDRSVEHAGGARLEVCY